MKSRNAGPRGPAKNWSSSMTLTEDHIHVLERLCCPEDRNYKITLRYDQSLRTYYVARESCNILHTITWKSAYRKNRIVRDLLKMGLIKKTRVVTYGKKIRTLEILYPTLKGEETFYRIFGYESWSEYADPQIHEYRGIDEVALDLTFRISDLEKLKAAVAQWPYAVSIIAPCIAKTIQILAMLGYRGYARVRIPGKCVLRLFLLSYW
ncbi:MAG: hypothetical protein GXO26_04755 [Crenarchaeota archaeon]|nr:hypothetical protein [Thermoproteota archaeon]